MATLNSTISKRMARTKMLSALLFSITFVPLALADGTGILGAGKWLYKPICAHTCRYILSTNPILCETSEEDLPKHYHDTNHRLRRRQHHMSPDDPVCFLLDDAFLRSVALCIDDYCYTEHAREDVTLSSIERWWSGHLATGSIGDWSEHMQPIMSYQDALSRAKQDLNETKGGLPYAEPEAPLNVTSRLREEDYVPTLNYQISFQWGEFDHGMNSLIISISCVCLPIVFSLFRFLPGYSRWSSRINAVLDQPLWGHKHRQPVAGNLGLMPTRGQSFIIGYILIINILLMCLPIRTLQPNVRMESHHMQRVQVIGDRAGVLAFALYVALFLFSARNNILIWLTGWSHGTFLLLHRWIAYACIFQTVMHSVLLLHYFVEWGDHAAESQLPYWYWGIVATLATCLMYPLSLLPVRQRMYEVFLATHQILAALVLVTAFLHIWYMFEFNWGYEIWIYVPGAIWFLDRVVRLARMACNGIRTADISLVEEDSDLLRVEVEGVVAEGHVYLYFPTLSWRFWESHPFSVLSTFGSDSAATGLNTHDAAVAAAGNEKSYEADEKRLAGSAVQEPTSDAPSTTSPPPSATAPVGPRMTVIVRPQTGTTTALLKAARAATGGKLKLPVLVESSYHANPSTQKLASCSTLVGIAGGVGITAVLPIARGFPGLRSRVFWSAKSNDVVKGLGPELKQLSSAVHMDIAVGRRLDVDGILREELLREDEQGEVAVVVCGPASMADDVRRAIGELVSSGKTKRSVVFVDEAFSW